MGRGKSLSFMVHKCLNSNVPEYLCNHFTRSDHKHSTRTSTSGSVNIPALRTVQGQRYFLDILVVKILLVYQ